MRWRSVIATLASAGCTVIVAGAMSAGPARAATGAMTVGARIAGTTAVRPAASALAVGHLGDARQVPGLAALNVGGSAEVSFMSCPGLGSCTAAGSYTDGAGLHQSFTVTEANGIWGQATRCPG
jgi:hypothetical protein